MPDPQTIYVPSDREAWTAQARALVLFLDLSGVSRAIIEHAWYLMRETLATRLTVRTPHGPLVLSAPWIRQNPEVPAQGK